MLDYPDWQQIFRLVGSDITINVNIEASTAILPVSIDAATVALDVNLTAATATISIIFTDQSVAVWSVDAWVARQGQEKRFRRSVSLAVGIGDAYDLYTIPAGKKLYVVWYKVTSEQKGLYNLLKMPGSESYGETHSEGFAAKYYTFIPPLTFAAGETVRVNAENYGTATAYFVSTVFGYELDA